MLTMSSFHLINKPQRGQKQPQSVTYEWQLQPKIMQQAAKCPTIGQGLINFCIIRFYTKIHFYKVFLRNHYAKVFYKKLLKEKLRRFQFSNFSIKYYIPFVTWDMKFFHCTSGVNNYKIDIYPSIDMPNTKNTQYLIDSISLHQNHKTTQFL